MTASTSYLPKWSMLLGNLCEHYDTALFSLLSPFLAPLFFPHQDPLIALILTYCMIPLGMIARPLGSLIFGYIGDMRGRRESLAIALTGMAFVTVCIGLLPTYDQAGVLAPIFLSLCRILQNFFGAGEVIGGAIYLIENTPKSQEDITSSFYNASTVAGALLASLGVSILCTFNIVQECWRLLYLLGFLTGIFGALLRMSISKHSNLPSNPLVPQWRKVFNTCWNRRQALFTIAIASGFSYACYMLALVMMNSFIPLVASTTNSEMMNLNTILLIVDMLLLIACGPLAYRFPREKMMIFSGILATLIGFPLFWFLKGASLAIVILIRLCFVMIGVWFSAPFYSWSQSLVPPSDRYTVISFAYAIGTQILGGPTIVISLWLFQQTDWIISAALYWMILGLLASYCIAKQKVIVCQEA